MWVGLIHLEYLNLSCMITWNIWNLKEYLFAQILAMEKAWPRIIDKVDCWITKKKYRQAAVCFINHSLEKNVVIFFYCELFPRIQLEWLMVLDDYLKGQLTVL